jgi:enoyl-CoA hydratase/carnithine racemase/3-hydroxyacyl-CoA dehydrogenase
MANSMRQSTLETLGLGSVLELFQNGKMPADAASLVDEVFGDAANRGSLVVSGANGIVGAGKMMQLGSRLEPYGVLAVGLDFPGAPDGIGGQYKGLVRAFGRDGANRIMSNMVQLTYDGKTLPAELAKFNPKFLLEAIPEILNVKKGHYELFRKSFPDIEIRSVTSGFPAKELGVGVAHPAFPHEINKLWETVEEKPSAITKLLWALGLIPVPVSDHWAFVLDVLFCGITQAATRYHEASNMPYWKIDKFVRKFVGPNPFRAHDAIGAAGANFLTWSCLHHLGEKYGGLFTPSIEMAERMETGQNWYPPNHFRPLINWSMDAAQEEEFENWILGPLYQMASLLLYENRGHLTHINTIGELCAQFRNGILAKIRSVGADRAVATVEKYHKLHPEAAGAAWHPGTFEKIGTPEWQQLYVNAEHDGNVGVISISRESYNSDVDAELNRAMDWLKAEGIANVILTGDFHLATQMVGADTSEFFPAMEDSAEGVRVSSTWSATARRLNSDFANSVGFINGKRCLGGMLELMVHCHYLVATNEATLGMPEVTLPVIPGMEGCHWPFRKAAESDWPKLVQLLLSGRSIRATQGVGWLIDFAGTMGESLQAAWKIASESGGGYTKRTVRTEALSGIPTGDLPNSGNPSVEAARGAIMSTIQGSCGTPLAEALDVQARHSGDFMVTKYCRKGVVGGEYTKTVKV